MIHFNLPKLAATLSISLLAATVSHADVLIADYQTDYSPTLQGNNGWNYLSVYFANSNDNPSTFDLMTTDPQGWTTVFGGQAAFIDSDSIAQTAALYAVVTWTASSDYTQLSLNLNGLTVNSGGRGMVRVWDDSDATWTDVLTLEGGQTYSDILMLNNLQSGDRIAISKLAGWGGVGPSYEITNFNPQVTAVPEPTTTALLIIGGLFGGAYLLRKKNGAVSAQSLT